MKTKIKKTISIILSIITVSTIVFGNNIFAYASLGNYHYTTDDGLSIYTEQIVPNGSVTNSSGDTYTATSMGGISVSASGNKLYVVKGGSLNDQIAVLYYYSDYTNASTRKTIKFRQKLLGHANAMAIDDKFIYVTRWCSNGTNGSKVLRISRKAINELSNNSQINNTNAKTSNGTTVCFDVPVYTKSDKSQTYTGKITAITGYEYNSNDRITKFIIDYPSANTSTAKGYIIANLNSGCMYVYNQPNKIIRVKNPYGSSFNGYNIPHYQDITYWSRYGLFIPVYYNKKDANGNNVSSKSNVILIYNLNNPNNDSNGELNPNHSIEINREKDENNRILAQYEIESISFTNVDSTSATHKMLLSTNRRTQANNTGCIDAIEMSSNFDSYMNSIWIINKKRGV